MIGAAVLIAVVALVGIFGFSAYVYNRHMRARIAQGWTQDEAQEDFEAASEEFRASPFVVAKAAAE